MNGERPSPTGQPQHAAQMRIARIGGGGAVPVLVTGGAGYIGSHAVHALRDAGRPLFGIFEDRCATDAGAVTEQAGIVVNLRSGYLGQGRLVFIGVPRGSV